MIAEPTSVVTAAQAGGCPSIDRGANRGLAWIPAFAGMTTCVGLAALFWMTVMGVTVDADALR